MITNLKPYPAYKDSGVPWLGEVPAHWEVVKLKLISKRIQNGSTPPTDMLEYYSDEGLPWYGPPSLGSKIVIGPPMRFVTEQAIADRKVRVIQPPALAVSVIGNVGKSALMLKPGATNQQITSFELNDQLCNPRFVVNQFRMAEECLVASASSATIAILDSCTLRNTPLTLPPLPEQTAIVRFLDWAERRIRRVIRARKKRIKLLEEYKQALIHQAVTGKIDVRTGKPYPAYKDSSVEWLGQVPEHWEVRRLKSATHLIMGQSPPSDDCSAEPIGLPFLQGCAEFGHVHPRAKQFCRRPVKVSPVGAILVSVRAPVGRLNVADQEYGIGRGLCAVVPVESLLDKTFVRYALSASVDGLAMSSTGSTYDAVSVSDVGSHCLPLPPLPEQTTIAAYLDAQTAKIDAAIASARREVELLREYRERLIADVVTGKVDVREVAAQLPEERPEDIEATGEEVEGEGEMDPAEIAESDIGGDADEV